MAGERKIRHLQVFLFCDEVDRIFCELTFFPEDVVRETFAVADFHAMIRSMASAAGSSEYYLRLENASWRHGDTASPDVILSHANGAPL
ncbi:hypothetical protein C9I28_25300 [Pseudoduganella armeniaca]|uniref:Uncharacterized protein n=1 Tax=Pseudoduganella armeniaca TaxID=2072590 RepID=A0A2R4CGJ7_9BURK|nr:hypothetical protein C9I28_25300 [Pseudoduganella armeniaca]